jgi:hypothetical protein
LYINQAVRSFCFHVFRLFERLAKAQSRNKNMSRVVNVKVENIRPQFQNLAAWCADPNNVYIGRPGVVFVDGKRFPPPAMCAFANPFKITAETSRDDAVKKYRAYAIQRMRTDAAFRREVFALRGKTLGCWCCPEACHGDVLVKLSKMGESDFVAAPQSKAVKASEAKRRQRTDDKKK